MNKSIFILFFFFCITAKSQTNLVPNPSFEDTVRCPTSMGDMVIPSACQHWYDPTGSTSDYYNSCSPGSVPINPLGYQYARTGVAYAGIVTNDYLNGINNRDYIQTKLDSVLIQNHTYCIKFYVSLSTIFNLATNNMGMYISDSLTPPPSCPLCYINVIPQINETATITDTAGWTLISGQYVAHGGEQYITIGNFYTDAQTDTVRVGSWNGSGGYYYIDDVSLIDCTGVGINEMAAGSEISIYPNPANEKLNIEIKGYKGKASKVKIYNVLSEMVKGELKMEDEKLTIDIEDLPNGLYFIEVQNKEGILRRKLVKE